MLLSNRNSSGKQSSEELPIKRKTTTKKGRGYTPTGIDQTILREKTYLKRKPQSIMRLFRDHSAEVAEVYSKEQHIEKPALE